MLIRFTALQNRPKLIVINKLNKICPPQFCREIFLTTLFFVHPQHSSCCLHICNRNIVQVTVAFTIFQSNTNSGNFKFFLYNCPFFPSNLLLLLLFCLLFNNIATFKFKYFSPTTPKEPPSSKTCHPF